MAIDDLLDEHEQGERVRSWLRSNAPVLLAGVALGIGAIYGWGWWGKHRIAQDQQAHAAYEAAVKQAEAGQDVGPALAGQQGTYASLAALRVAKAQVEAGKTEAAIATLRGIQADDVMAPLVQQRLAQLLAATGKPDEALQLLEGRTDGVALELRGDALVVAGKRDEARDAYAKALAGLDVEAPARRRVELKLQDAGGQVPDPAQPI